MSQFSVALLALGGVLLLLLAWWLRRGSGVPLGEITYSDTDAPAQPLISNRYQLVGKPDYIVRRRGMLIPIEVKPNRAVDEPYEGDRLQMAAYFLLIEESNATRPPFGVLKYRNQSFRIDNGALLRGRLLRTMDEIRAGLDADDVPRSHHSAARCASCGFSRSCEESLAG